MANKASGLDDVEKMITRQRAIVNEMNSIFNYMKNSDSPEERRMIYSQILALNGYLRRAGQQAMTSLEKVSLFKPLNQEPQAPQTAQGQPPVATQKITTATTVQPQQPMVTQPTPGVRLKPDDLETLALERLKRTERRVKKKKERKPSVYIKFANKFFHNASTNMIEKGYFKTLKRDLVRANMEYVPAAWVSVIFFTTFLSIFVAVFGMLFFWFFSLSALPPFILRAQEELLPRFWKVFWVPIVLPAATFIFTYFYPVLEKRSTEGKINQELPFAVIHMSSISSSMIEPSKIFSIISATHEYPYLEKEFTKLQNEINVYGYDLVTALKNRSLNSPSKKLAELLNGLSTTITSGGDLPGFFDKRAQTLLFEHKLDREKEGKANETFMDIYISVVIAAPMILMLLLMMMRISGIGLSLSTSTITLIMILGVTLVNLFFLTFLHLKRPEGA